MFIFILGQACDTTFNTHYRIANGTCGFEANTEIEWFGSSVGAIPSPAGYENQTILAVGAGKKSSDGLQGEVYNGEWFN